jgi:hypothetical protein
VRANEDDDEEGEAERPNALLVFYGVRIFDADFVRRLRQTDFLRVHG